jgi:chemotaxis protein MotB
MVSACVRPKIYREEQGLRLKAEARESVLVKEVLDRRAEVAKLTELIGNLNRTLGKQDVELATLNAELTARTQSMDQSTTKLISEKEQLKKEIAALKSTLEQRNELLGRIRDAQAHRTKICTDLKSALAKAFEKPEGAEVTQEGEVVSLTLPDKALFEPNGLAVSAAGKEALTPLAAFLAERPGLNVDIVCFTDNAMPKDKTLKDTWDWSLQRATNITRLLIREFNVNANQLTPVGKGEFYPVASNEAAEGRQKNRRTVVVLKPVFIALPAAE